MILVTSQHFLTASRRLLLAASVCFTLAPSAVVAEQVIFTIESASMSVSGSDLFFGALVEQAPGSTETTASGHFLVEFDPFGGAPTELTFLFGHGWMEFADSGSWLPGPEPATNPASQTTPAPANFALRDATNQMAYVSRNARFDFRNLDQGTPIPVDPGDGSFDISALGAKNLPGGTVDFLHPLFGGYGTIPLTGTAELLPGGTASLVETSPGEWTMTFTGTAQGSYGDGFGTLLYTTETVAKATFNADNIDTIGTGATTGSALGGAAVEGGLDVAFDQVDVGGQLTAQQIDTTGLSQDAVEALDANFMTAGDSPQIWNIDFDGEFVGDALLTFKYDEDQLGTLAEEDLFIWHFDEELDQWEQIFGVVDPLANTITVSADSFSPFALGMTAVPEPSSLAMAGIALLGGTLIVRRRRGKRLVA